MPLLHPQFIKDTAGKNLVVMPQDEFDKLMEAFDELEDIRVYDEAKKNDTGERIPMEEAFKIIETKSNRF
jgi:PHD/YefM family antitoxin component YafN of YafNO toxin-antitoxin module